jgi:FkbM family methyltransferase
MGVTNPSIAQHAPGTTGDKAPTARMRRRVHRVRQTFTAFTNWAPILLRLGGGRRLSSSLTFRTRTGLVITCPNVPGARVPMYEIFAEDCYHLSSFLGDAIGEPIRVVDIGAHVGTFACELSRLAPRAEIHCFEPSPTTAAYLARNAAANGFASRIEVTEAAVTAEIGETRLIDNGGGSGLNHLASTQEQSGDGIAVNTTTFDAITADVGGAQFVKMDCEGGEYDLVLGSSPQSWDSVERVVIEYHPHPRHAWPELREWFAERGLKVLQDEPCAPEQGTAWLTRTQPTGA